MNALTRDLVKLVNITEENQAAKEQTSGAQFREKLHLMPPVGWLNDPNGLCQMDNRCCGAVLFCCQNGFRLWL